MVPVLVTLLDIGVLFVGVAKIVYGVLISRPQNGQEQSLLE
ncbi:MAG TPA: hypothetical protein VJ583_00375 [Nitrososphaeraceae archaeon]|nr:hypothetical protein [Nitrososphaeraceae archaeon]